MPKQEVRIEFTQKGAPKLINTIKELNKVTKNLAAQTIVADKALDGYDNTVVEGEEGHNHRIKTNSTLLGQFAVLRNKLLLLAFAYNAVLKPVVNVSKAGVQQAAQFEALQVRLIALFGSIREGKDAFEEFNNVAKTTPFMVEDIVNAGAQLQAFGADSRALLKDITNLAAFMGTNATEAANAFGRAFAGGAGAADILRERGILNLVKEFKGVEDISKLTLPEFRKALIEMIQDPTMGIAGATDLLASTFQGKYSNMQDSVSRLSAAFGTMLTPSTKSWMDTIIRMTGSWTDFISSLGETELETTVRRLKMMGTAAEDLEGMELQILQESQIEILTNAHSQIRDIMRDMGAFSAKAGWEHGMAAFFDVTHLFDWNTSFGIAAEENHNLFDKWLSEYTTKLPVFTEIWEDSKAIIGSWFGEEWGSTEQLSEMKADLNAIVRDPEGLKGIEDKLIEISAKMLEASKADVVDQEQLDNLFKVWSSLNNILSVGKQYQAALEQIEKQMKEMKKDKEPVIPPLFNPDDVTMIGELNKMLEKTDMKRKEVLNTYKDFLVTRKEDLTTGEKATFTEAEYAAVLGRVNSAIDKISGKKIHDKKELKNIFQFVQELKKQQKEYENMQEILEALEGLGFWENVPEHLRKHSDSYTDHNAKIEEMQGIFDASYAGQLKLINSQIDYIKTLDDENITMEEKLVIIAELEKKLEEIKPIEDPAKNVKLSPFEALVERIQKAKKSKEDLSEATDKLKASWGALYQEGVRLGIIVEKNTKKEQDFILEMESRYKSSYEGQRRKLESDLKEIITQRVLLGQYIDAKKKADEHNKAVGEARKVVHGLGLDVNQLGEEFDRVPEPINKSHFDNMQKLEIIVRSITKDFKKLGNEFSTPLVPTRDAVDFEALFKDVKVRIPVMFQKPDSPEDLYKNILEGAEGIEIPMTPKLDIAQTLDMPELFSGASLDISAKFGGSLDPMINELKDMHSQFEAVQEASGKTSDSMQESMDLINEAIENLEIADKVMAIADSLIQVADMFHNTLSSLHNVMSQNLQNSINREMKDMKKSAKYRFGDAKTRAKMEEDVQEKFRDERLKSWKQKRLLDATGVAIDTARAVMGAVKESPTKLGMPWSAIIATMGLVQAGIIMSQKPPEFEHGGLIGGNRHTQGGTLINAERGEFVMRRSAVDTIGTDTLEALNTGDLAPITINISGNVMTDEFVSGELSEKIRDAVRRGVEFN